MQDDALDVDPVLLVDGLVEAEVVRICAISSGVALRPARSAAGSADGKHVEDEERQALTTTSRKRPTAMRRRM